MCLYMCQFDNEENADESWAIGIFFIEIIQHAWKNPGECVAKGQKVKIYKHYVKKYLWKYQ